jgi:hypothetical protein
MKPKNWLFSVCWGFLAITACAPALAIEVYQWTDDNGVVHFSQWAPDDGVKGVETVSVEGGVQQDNGIGISEADDPQGYQAHREEMELLWAEIEARREAERERQARAPSTEIVYVPSEPRYEYPYFGPGFGLLPPFRPDRPPHRPKPEQPLPSVPFKRP